MKLCFSGYPFLVQNTCQRLSLRRVDFPSFPITLPLVPSSVFADSSLPFLWILFTHSRLFILSWFLSSGFIPSLYLWCKHIIPFVVLTLTKISLRFCFLIHWVVNTPGYMVISSAPTSTSRPLARTDRRCGSLDIGFRMSAIEGAA